MSEQPISRRIELGTGLRYHLLEWEAEADHTVVLLHGFLDLAWGWSEVAGALAGQFHVVAPDLRGHGDSDRVGPGGYYHFVDYVADLEDLLRQVGRGRVSLVGHSMGGSVAAYYAGSFPERIHRLALLEGLGPPDSDEAIPARVRTWIDSWRRVRERAARSYAGVAEAAVRLQAHDPLLTRKMAEDLASRGTRAGDDGRLRFKHDPLHAVTGPTPFRLAHASEFWRRITCPVLLVEGARSAFRYTYADLEQRAGAFASAERAVLAGAGHMMQRHQPATLADMLRTFLSR